MSAADCNSVSRASFSGKQMLELWQIFCGSGNVSEAFGCLLQLRQWHAIAPITSAFQHTFQLPQKSSKASTTVFSCTCFETYASYDPVEPAKSVGPVKILAEEAIRTIHANGREDESKETHQVVAPRPGPKSRRLRGRFPSCWTSGALLVLRDVSTPYSVWRTLATRELYQQTLEHILTSVAKRISVTLNGTQMTTSLTMHCNAQFILGVQRYWGSKLMVAFIHECSQHSLHRRGIRPRFHWRLRGWIVLIPSHTRQLVPPTSSVIRSWSFLSAHQEDGQCTQTIPPNISIHLDCIGNGAAGSRRS